MSLIGLAAISALTWVMLTDVALAKSKGGIVGADSIALLLIFGIINGGSADVESTNVKLEHERLFEADGGETADCPDCAKTLMAKAATKKIVTKLNVVVFFRIFHLCSRIATLNK